MSDQYTPATQDEADDVLLRADFGREMFARMDNPLHFILHETMAIVERGVPPAVALSLPSYKRITVTVTAD